MPKILHIADVHFDTGFACKSARVRSALRAGVREAFRRSIDDAVALGVDAFVIAGDLFDGIRIRLDTERFVLSQFERLGSCGIPVFYATGNHDPMVRGSAASEISWPDNVVVAGGRDPSVHEITTDGGVLRLVCAGHDSTSVVDNLAAAFPVFDDGVPTVGVLHTNVESHVSSREHRPYAPSTIADLDDKGYSYWALGHVHGPSAVCASPSVYYSGCLQGRHFQESGPRGGYLVTVDAGGRLVVEARQYGKVQWERLPVVISGEMARLSDLDDMFESALYDRIARLPDDATVEYAVRVELSGATGRAVELRDEDQLEILASRWRDDYQLLYVEIDSRHVHRSLDLDSLREEPTVLSEAMSLIAELGGLGSSGTNSTSATSNATALLDRVFPSDLRAGVSDESLDLSPAGIESLCREVAERLCEDVT